MIKENHNDIMVFVRGGDKCICLGAVELVRSCFVRLSSDAVVPRTSSKTKIRFREYTIDFRPSVGYIL